MKGLKKIGRGLLAIVLIIACIAVIGLNYKTVLAGHKIKDIADNAKSVEDIDIPDNVKIVGVGEATHGSVRKAPFYAGSETSQKFDPGRRQ